jgi:hypothetical protein
MVHPAFLSKGSSVGQISFEDCQKPELGAGARLLKSFLSKPQRGILPGRHFINKLIL